MFKKFYVIILVLVQCMVLTTSCEKKCMHTNKTLIGSTATCEKSGVSTFKCNDCGREIQENAPALQHDFSIFVEDTATCKESGNTIYRCSRCDAMEKQYSAVKNHTFKNYFCEVCGSMADGFKSYNFEGKKDPLENIYGSDWGYFELFLKTEEGSRNFELSAWVMELKYSGVIMYKITVLNATKKTLECEISSSKSLSLMDKYKGYILNFGANKTMQNPYNSNDSYYIKFEANFIRA